MHNLNGAGEGLSKPFLSWDHVKAASVKPMKSSWDGSSMTGSAFSEYVSKSSVFRRKSFNRSSETLANKKLSRKEYSSINKQQYLESW